MDFGIYYTINLPTITKVFRVVQIFNIHIRACTHNRLHLEYPRASNYAILCYYAYAGAINNSS